MPVHSVELGHFVLLNVTIQDTGEISLMLFKLLPEKKHEVFKPSDFSIINTDGHSDFDVENKLTLRDQQGRKLELRLNYM